MKESTLLKFSLACSLTGILILLLIVESTNLPITNISSIDKSSLDNIVKIKGVITRISETPGLYILTIQDSTGEITGIIFKEESLNIKQDNELTITGQVTLYEDKLEIISKEIKI